MEDNTNYIDKNAEVECDIELERWKCREFVLRTKDKYREIIQRKETMYHSIIAGCIGVIIVLFLAIAFLISVNTYIFERITEIVTQDLVEANQENVELQNIVEYQNQYIYYLEKMLDK